MVTSAGTVLCLIANLQLAVKIVKVAKRCHLDIQNSDKAESFLKRAHEKKPVLMIFDLVDREAEAFKLMREIKQDETLKTVPAVGFVSQSKYAVKEEAQRAGCHRVYFKQEFLRELEDLFTRYAL